MSSEELLILIIVIVMVLSLVVVGYYSYHSSQSSIRVADGTVADGAKGDAQTTVVQQQRTENYCGPISWLIGCFVFPCIAFCPVDTRQVADGTVADGAKGDAQAPAVQQQVRTENYCGPISWLIGCFVFPCICFCPVDTRQVADGEVADEAKGNAQAPAGDESKATDECSTIAPVEALRGWFEKKDGFGWYKRWCVLDAQGLRCWVSENETAPPAEVVVLDGVQVSCDRFKLTLTGAGKMELKAKTIAQAELWVDRIKEQKKWPAQALVADLEMGQAVEA